MRTTKLHALYLYWNVAFRFGFLIYRFFCYIYGKEEDVTGLLETILLRQYEPQNNLLYIEIVHLLAYGSKESLLEPETIYLLARIINSLENKGKMLHIYNRISNRLMHYIFRFNTQNIQPLQRFGCFRTILRTERSKTYRHSMESILSILIEFCGIV